MNLNLWNKCLFSLCLLFEVISTAADLYVYLPIFFLLLERKNFNSSVLVPVPLDCTLAPLNLTGERDWGRQGVSPVQGVPDRAPAPCSPVSSTTKMRKYPGKIAHNPNINVNLNMLYENLQRRIWLTTDSSKFYPKYWVWSKLHYKICIWNMV